jgi:hypothetical protein
MINLLLNLSFGRTRKFNDKFVVLPVKSDFQITRTYQMVTPHIDAVLATLCEPRFFTESRSSATGAAQGESYAKILKKEFDLRRVHAEIEAGLSLGFYAVHTQENKHK